MILSTNSSNRRTLILSLILLWLSGCTVAGAPAKRAGQETPALGGSPLIAVLPVYNLSGLPAPLHDIRAVLINTLKRQGVTILDEKDLDRIILKHRIRYIGGISKSIAQVFREEARVEAVLITSVELYNEAFPPKIALTSRLVSTQQDIPILWMDGIGRAGDDAPGILGLSLIQDPRVLLQQTLEHLADSLADYFSEQKETVYPLKQAAKFRPKGLYSSPVLSPELKYRVAVVPFFNISLRPYAEDLMALHFVRHLRALGNFEVVEPGEVREALLELRVIMDDGISVADAEAVFSILDVDLILNGKVIDYQDFQGSAGKPKVDFSASLFEKKSREIVWLSRSYNEGDEGVVFFGLGKVNTAHTLSSAMVQQAVGMIFK